MLHDALLFQFVVVGEAVEHLSEDTRAQAPEVPWRDVAALRDLITHEYFRISVERRSSTVICRFCKRPLRAFSPILSRSERQWGRLTIARRGPETKMGRLTRRF